MKHLKSYNESVRSFMKPKSEEEIDNSLKNLSPNERLLKSSKHGVISGVISALNDGADVHYNNDYALRWASINGHTEIVKLLLENGADINIKNIRYNTAFILAAENGSSNVANYLKGLTDTE